MRQASRSRNTRRGTVYVVRKIWIAIWKGFGELLRGCIFAATDRADQATQLIGAGLSALAAVQMTLFAPFLHEHVVGPRARDVRPSFGKAQNALSEALDAVSKTNERWHEAEIHRTAGELAVSLPHADPKMGELHFQQSLAIARRQNAKSFELRALQMLCPAVARPRKNGMKRANCSRQFSAGSPRAST